MVNRGSQRRIGGASVVARRAAADCPAERRRFLPCRGRRVRGRWVARGQPRRVAAGNAPAGPHAAPGHPTEATPRLRRISQL